MINKALNKVLNKVRAHFKPIRSRLLARILEPRILRLIGSVQFLVSLFGFFFRFLPSVSPFDLLSASFKLLFLISPFDFYQLKTSVHPGTSILLKIWLSNYASHFRFKVQITWFYKISLRDSNFYTKVSTSDLKSGALKNYNVQKGSSKQFDWVGKLKKDTFLLSGSIMQMNCISVLVNTSPEQKFKLSRYVQMATVDLLIFPRAAFCDIEKKTLLFLNSNIRKWILMNWHSMIRWQAQENHMNKSPAQTFGITFS